MAEISRSYWHSKHTCNVRHTWGEKLRILTTQGPWNSSWMLPVLCNFRQMFSQVCLLTLIKFRLDWSMSTVSKKSVKPLPLIHGRSETSSMLAKLHSPDILYLGEDVWLVLANGIWMADIPFGLMQGSADYSLLTKFGSPQVFVTFSWKIAT